MIPTTLDEDLADLPRIHKTLLLRADRFRDTWSMPLHADALERAASIILLLVQKTATKTTPAQAAYLKTLEEPDKDIPSCMTL